MPTFTKEQVKEISEQLDYGFRAFYHKQTGDLIFVPNTDEYFDEDTNAWQDDLDKLDKNPSEYEEIEAMEASDSFRVMADFVEQLTDTNLKGKLITALSRKKPFSNFKFLIDNAGGQRQSWFDFKNKRYIDWVEEQIEIQNDIDQQGNASH